MKQAEALYESLRREKKIEQPQDQTAENYAHDNVTEITRLIEAALEESNLGPEALKHIILDSKKPISRRLWFVLASFPTTVTVDGFTNNQCGVSHLLDYERRHSYGRFWSPRRGKLDLT